MVIHKYKSAEYKGYIHYVMVVDCIYQWGKLNNLAYSKYPKVMNMGTRRYDYELRCIITSSNHFNTNKW